MDEFFINWKQMDLATMEEEIESHFFLLAVDNTLKYIGFSYQLSLQQEVKAVLKNLSLNAAQTDIWSGKFIVNLLNNSEINRQLAEEAWCLLINEHQPAENRTCRKHYHGRTHLKLHNHDCKLLKASVAKSNQEFGLAS